jgi:hypothetical protein
VAINSYKNLRDKSRRSSPARPDGYLRLIMFGRLVVSNGAPSNPSDNFRLKEIEYLRKEIEYRTLNQWTTERDLIIGITVSYIALATLKLDSITLSFTGDVFVVYSVFDCRCRSCTLLG